MAGIAYVTTIEATAVLAAFGVAEPADFDIAINRASRFVDGLPFAGDDAATPWRYGALDDVPERVRAATALLAAALPAADASESPVRRLPRSIRAGDVTLDFPVSAEAAPSDDAMAAARYGIPSVAAFRLLRPLLAPLDPAPEAAAAPASGGGRVVGELVETFTEFGQFDQ